MRYPATGLVLPCRKSFPTAHEAAIMTAVTAEEFRKAMRCFPGAVSIVATHDCERPTGMVVTATCSLAADPPMLLACINQSATSHQPVQRAGRFTVNVLSAADVEIAKH